MYIGCIAISLLFSTYKAGCVTFDGFSFSLTSNVSKVNIECERITFILESPQNFKSLEIKAKKNNDYVLTFESVGTLSKRE